MTQRRVVCAALIALLLAGCESLTQPNDARRILEDAGYTQITITGYKCMSCSKDDVYHTGFVATGPTGKRVSGTVCAGVFFKNSTIRFE